MATFGSGASINGVTIRPPASTEVVVGAAIRSAASAGEVVGASVCTAAKSPTVTGLIPRTATTTTVFVFSDPYQKGPDPLSVFDIFLVSSSFALFEMSK